MSINFNEGPQNEGPGLHFGPQNVPNTVPKRPPEPPGDAKGVIGIPQGATKVPRSSPGPFFVLQVWSHVGHMFDHVLAYVGVVVMFYVFFCGMLFDVFLDLWE